MIKMELRQINSVLTATSRGGIEAKILMNLERVMEALGITFNYSFTTYANGNIKIKIDYEPKDLNKFLNEFKKKELLKLPSDGHGD